MSDVEHWLPVVDYEGLYEVSDMGRVRSLDRVLQTSAGWSRFHRGKSLLGCINSSGYHVVRLGYGHDHDRLVHRLVLAAFVGPCPDDMEGCHGNGVRSDNRLSNLRWDTRSANHYDKVRHGNDIHRSRVTCPQGHKLEEPNLSAAAMAKRGHRRCLACERAHANASAARRKGQYLNFKTVADDHYRDIMAGTSRVYQGNRTRCPRDHPLAGANLVPHKLARGERSCLACARAHDQAKAAKRRGLESQFDFKATSDRNYLTVMAGGSTSSHGSMSA